jgi:hypothetical protein
LTALESVDASKSSGAVVATIDGAATAFAGGSGKDSITAATVAATTNATTKRLPPSNCRS